MAVTPTFDSLERTSLADGMAYYTPIGGADGDVTTEVIAYIRRYQSGSGWTRVNASPWPGTRSVRVPVPDGTSQWEVHLRANGPKGLSAPTSAKILEPWWQKPAALDVQTPTRNASGQVVHGWSRTVTERAPITSIVVRRAPLTSGDFVTVKTLSGTATSWTDTASVPQMGYRYQLIAVNSAGEATPVQTVTVQPSVTRPAAPSSVTATALSLNRASVEWPAVAGATSYRVHTRDEGQTEAVYQNTTASTSITLGLGSNRAVQFAVQAVNIAGRSEAMSPWSDMVVTTPRGADMATARRVGSDIEVELHLWASITPTGTAPAGTIATGWELERSTDGSTGWSLAASATSGTARKLIFRGASYGVPHHLRVRPTRDGAPTAPWVTVSPVVPAGGQPDPPTPLTAGFVPLGEPVEVRWAHNSVDGTSQTAATVNWRRVSSTGAQVATGTVTATTAESATLPASVFVAGQTVEWWVQTTGSGSAAASPWSPRVTLAPVQRPTVTLTGPGATVTGTSATVSWTTASQQAAHVRLLDADGNPVGSWELGEQRSLPVDVADRESYTVEVTVFDGRLWSAPQTRTFTVMVDRPLPPTLAAEPIGAQVRLTTASTTWDETRRNYALSRDLSDWTTNGISTVTFDDGGSGVLMGDGSSASKPHFVYGDIKVAFTARARDSAATLTVRWKPVTDTLTEAVQVGTEWARHEVVIRGGDIDPHANPLLSLEVTGELYLRDLVVTGADADAVYFDGASEDAGHLYRTVPGDNGHAYHQELIEASGGTTVSGPTVERTEILRWDAGEWVRVADVDGGVGWDSFPRFCQPETYIARAHSAQSWSDSAPVTVTVRHRDSVLNFGDGLAAQVTCGPITTSGSGARDREERTYVGARYATVYEADVPAPRRVRVQATLFPRNSGWDEWIAAMSAPGEKLLRTPSGLVLYGNIVADPSWNPGSRWRSDVSFDFVETGPRP